MTPNQSSSHIVGRNISLSQSLKDHLLAQMGEQSLARDKWKYCKEIRLLRLHTKAGATNFSPRGKLTCSLGIRSYSNGIQVVRNKGIRTSIPALLAYFVTRAAASLG